MITDLEREKAVGLLERSKRVLADTLAGAEDDELRWRMRPEKWTILEYVEHLAVAEGVILETVRKSLESPPRAETPEERKAREDHLRARATAPHKNKAPQSMTPTGRFAGLEPALGAFAEARGRSLDFARTTSADLRSHFTSHPAFGALDAYQWLVTNARHVELHAGHIKEIREAWRAARQK